MDFPPALFGVLLSPPSHHYSAALGSSCLSVWLPTVRNQVRVVVGIFPLSALYKAAESAGGTTSL
jgi:hypothetical protein